MPSEPIEIVGDTPVPPAKDPMQEILDRLNRLENQNKALAEKNIALEQALAETAAQGHLLTGDTARSGLRMDVARSVTIPTRPVIENPDQYANVVNLGNISQRGGN